MHQALVIKRLFSQFRASGLSGLATAAAASTAPIATAYVVDAAAEGAPAKRIKLLPMGAVLCRDGRQFLVENEAHARQIVAASQAYAASCDIPVDYDHQIVNAPKAGGVAPAAGWITALTVQPDGIYGDVTWTATAAAHLAERSYRYISPAFRHDKSGRVLRIDNAGLVNLPAMTELPALAAADAAAAANLSTTENDVEPLSKIATALGLPATATLDDIIGAIAGMKPMMAACATLTAAAPALGLAAGADAAALATAAVAAASATPDPAKFAPITVVEELRGKLATLSAERGDQRIAAAKADGKLTPAMEPWARDYLAKDPAGFEGWLATAAVIVPPGEIAADPLATAAVQHGLTADEIDVAKRLGLTPAAFAAAK